MTQNYKNNNYTLFFIIKSINMIYLGILYSFIGGGLSFFINYLYPERTEQICRKMNIFKLGLESILMSSTYFLLIYYTRLIVKQIGSPLDNIAGFDFYRLQELSGGVVLALSVILYSPKIIIMARILSERITNYFNNNQSNQNNKESDYSKVLKI